MDTETGTDIKSLHSLSQCSQSHHSTHALPHVRGTEKRQRCRERFRINLNTAAYFVQAVNFDVSFVWFLYFPAVLFSLLRSRYENATPICVGCSVHYLVSCAINKGGFFRDYIRRRRRHTFASL